MKKLIYSRPDYELYLETHKVSEGITGIVLTTRWPQARTDREEHKILNLSVPDDTAVELWRCLMLAGGEA